MKKLIGRIKMRMLKWLLHDICRRRDCGKCEFAEVDDPIYLRLQAVDIEDLFNLRGYVYLNQIYETFGIGWNPSDENVCYLLGSGPIEFKFEPMENGRILVHIS